MFTVEKGKTSGLFWLEVVNTGKVEVDSLDSGHPVWWVWEAYLAFSLFSPELEVGSGRTKIRDAAVTDQVLNFLEWLPQRLTDVWLLVLVAAEVEGQECIIIRHLAVVHLYTITRFPLTHILWPSFRPGLSLFSPLSTASYFYQLPIFLSSAF